MANLELRDNTDASAAAIVRPMAGRSFSPAALKSRGLD
jgi:hypothetical protein